MQNWPLEFFYYQRQRGAIVFFAVMITTFFITQMVLYSLYAIPPLGPVPNPLEKAFEPSLVVGAIAGTIFTIVSFINEFSGDGNND
jgi:hypothetical protein